MKQLVKNEVKKHVGAIHVSGQLSLIQHKASNILLINAYEDLLAKEQHRISVIELANAIGFDSNNLDYLKEALKGMIGVILEWNLLDQKGNEDWEAMPLLSYVRINRGHCYYAYPEELRRKLYNPEVYAIVSAAIQQKFTSAPALKLYENLARYRRVQTTGWIDLELLKKMLGVEESDYYQEFKRLNSKVLKPAVEEINQTTDLLVAMQPPLRESRRVVAVKFRIEDNPQLPLFQRPAERQAIEGQVVTEGEVASPHSEDTRSASYDRLLTFGLTDHQANKAIAKFDDAYIEENLAVVEQDYRAGKVQNLRAYTVAALRDDYRIRKSALEANAEAAEQGKKQQKLRQEQARQRLDGLRKEFEAERLDQALAALGDLGRRDLEWDFQAMLQGANDSGHVMIRKFYKQHGLASRPVQAFYRGFVRERLLGEPREEAFTAFVQGRGHELARLQAEAGGS
jgi:hypothetical protein